MNEMRSSSPQPPSRANLKAWWKGFIASQKLKRDPTAQVIPGKNPPPGDVFGVPLRDSLRYANVPISTAGGNGGKLYIYGYVPVVVAKCGLHLKETATEVEGTFRVNGSAKRMRELQTLFETPPRYGKNLEWKGSIFTTHDVASVFRRYLTQMPEPVIPHNLYHKFRDAHAEQPPNRERVIKTFQSLIKSMPRANQYLLLYVLDLLSVFARKSDKNLMTAANLAVIFRPGILSHPDIVLNPQEHKLSQEVVEFLIEHQDLFLLDIPPPPRNDSILMPTHHALRPQTPQDDFYMVPSESDEDAPPRGGWKLIENKDPHKLTPTLSNPPSPGGILSGVDIALSGGGGANVKRSVTVPSRKSPKSGSPAHGRLYKRRKGNEVSPDPDAPSNTSHSGGEKLVSAEAHT